MKFWKFLVHEIKGSKAYIIMGLIVLISMSFMILFGPKLSLSPIINIILWALYMLVPTLSNAIGGVYLQYKKQENNLIAILALLLISYVGLIILISIFNSLTISAIRNSAIIYGIISIFSTIVLRQILNIENLIHIEKKYCPDILKTIPLPKRGDLWGLQANDHYVNIITSKGNHMVYSSLANAIGNSTPINGVQIHRSYWIAQDGLKDIVRRNNRYVCILKNGMEINASRKGVEEMRKLEWIKGGRNEKTQIDKYTL